MSLEQLIASYGCLAVFLGTFLEGETVLILGGFAAHRGYLRLDCVMAAAFAGSILGDQFYFLLGRFHSRLLMEKRPSWKPRMDRFRALLDRRATLVILSFRFLYGLRTIGPFAIGAGGVSIPRFVLLNIIGGAVWAVVIAAAGYFFGHAMEIIIADLKRYELAVAGIIALVAVTLFSGRVIVRRIRRGRPED
jgi:membrane protein DedA with SNARE-associated domain